jgi:putative glutathione S-transferase
MDGGTWRLGDPPARIREGHYMRPTTQFRSWISRDGSSGHAAASGRYHLYVAHACPWAHRTLMLRALKGLEACISVSYADPLMLEQGWVLPQGDGPVPEARHMHDVYRAARPDYSGRCSVPVLWDRETASIVSNESADIVRMLNVAFDAFATRSLPDLYPPALRERIDQVNDRVYRDINNGVYRCGFATTQAAYEESFARLFEALDHFEAHLGSNRYLCGERITEADWRLFATLVRFDAVYVGHFKCNRQRIADYPNLSGYTRELYQWPGIAATVDVARIKQHYYGSHESINPRRIVPVGPALDLDAAHCRGGLPAAGMA